jgi:probable F420-dependent oxidoreductase
MSGRGFRFGVCLIDEEPSRQAWIDKCRRAEDLGYDVILAPDHLNLAAPMTSVLLAAEATRRPRVGTYVVNCSFTSPALLAREIATLDRFVEGRLDVGLGTGYVEWEFARAGVPFHPPRSRVDALERMTVALDSALRQEGSGVAQRPRPPFLVGGHGDRVLRIAAAHADVISFVGAFYRAEYQRMILATREEMVGRTAFVRAAAGERADKLELNILSKTTLLSPGRESALSQVRRFGPHLSDEQILDSPAISVGSPAGIAEQHERNREELGITYITVMEAAMESFGTVIPLLS